MRYADIPDLLQCAGPLEGVLTLSLHRPLVRNALSTPLLAALVQLLERAEQDAAVAVVVLTS